MLPKLYGGDIYIIQFSIQNKILFFKYCKKMENVGGGDADNASCTCLHFPIFYYNLTVKLKKKCSCVPDVTRHSQNIE